MSKKYRGKTCVYCGADSASTADHVFARQFFLSTRRVKLPKVPACTKCNGDKSRLEHYLASVLPFGGMHHDAVENLSTAVERRLKKNVRLHRELTVRKSHTWQMTNAGLYVPALTLPFEGACLERLFGMIAQGLLWHHWRVILHPQDDFVMSLCLTASGVEKLEDLFAEAIGDLAEADLGNGTFTYHGRHSPVFPQFSFWRFTIYGGLMLGGDDKVPGGISTALGVITGPKRAKLSEIPGTDPFVAALRQAAGQARATPLSPLRL